MMQKSIRYEEIVKSSQENIDILDALYLKYLNERFIEVYYDVTDNGAQAIWDAIVDMIDSGLVTAKDFLEIAGKQSKFLIQETCERFAFQSRILNDQKIDQWLAVEQQKLEEFLLK